MRKLLIAAILLGIIEGSVTGFTVADASIRKGPTTYQQFNTNQSVAVNATTGPVKVATSRILPASTYVVHVSIQGLVTDSPNFLACGLSTTGSSDIDRYDPGALGIDTGGPGNTTGNVTFNGTIVITGSGDQIVVTCSDGDPTGATLASWSITEQPVSSLTVN